MKNRKYLESLEEIEKKIKEENKDIHNFGRLYNE